MTKSTALLLAVLSTTALLASANPIPSSATATTTSSQAHLAASMTNEELAIACSSLPEYRRTVSEEMSDLQRRGFNDEESEKKLEQDKLNLRKATAACRRIAQMNGADYEPEESVDGDDAL